VQAHAWTARSPIAASPRLVRVRRAARLANVVTAVAVACAAAPIVAASARSIAAGWVPAGDQANIAVRAYDVFTSHTPLVGLHSDVSLVTGRSVYSLGPMLFWLLSLPARFGPPWSLVLTMGIVNTAAVAGAVLLARRRGGIGLMLLTALVLAVMTRSLAPEVLHDIWNPSAGLMPFTLLIFLAWSVACGELWLLPLTLLVASFVLQCQLAFAPPCVGLLAVALGGLALSLRDRERRPRHALRWLGASLAVLAVCWTAPLIDQIEGSPGNISRIVQTVEAKPPALGAVVGLHAVERAVGVAPWWATHPSSPWSRKEEVREHTGTARFVTTWLVLAALALMVTLGTLTRRREVATAGLIGLLLCAALGAVAATTPERRTLAETLGYTMWWGSPAGAFAWIAVAWGAALASAAAAPALAASLRLRLPRPSPRLAPALVGAGALVVAGAAAAIAGAQGADYHRPEYAPVKALRAALARDVPRGRTVQLQARLGGQTFRFKMAARYALVTRGVRPLSPGIDTRLGSWYELDHHRYDCSLYIDDGASAPVAGSRAIAHLDYDYGAGPNRVTVWMTPYPCRASPAPGASSAARRVAGA
jgi:hypothetical protein